MTETLSSLNTKLEKAQGAYEKLMLGESVVEFEDSNGERVRYNQANRGSLAAYISEIERKIAVLQGMNVPVKPMRVWF